MSLVDVLLNPIASGINLGIKTGASIFNSIINREPIFPDLKKVFSAPASPVVVNLPAAKPEPFFNLGFVEKNVILIGVFALGAVAIMSYSHETPWKRA